MTEHMSTPAMAWGVAVGLAQTATPLLFWWLDTATVYAIGIIVIAPIYIGFAVADGRLKIIAVESGVAMAFVIVAAAAVTGSPWLLVLGLVGHGLKDLWQHRTHFVSTTRWLAAVHGRRLRRRGGHRHRDRSGLALPLAHGRSLAALPAAGPPISRLDLRRADG